MNSSFGKRRAFLAMVLMVASAALLMASVLPPNPDEPPQYGPWSTPANMGPNVNTGWTDMHPCISKDGLSLYFVSKAPDPRSDFDIYVVQRATVNDPWGLPQDLGLNVNSLFDDGGPAFSPDGHSLYFHSTRPGGFCVAPANDLYVSRRHNKRDDFGWQPAENLGSGINVSNNDVNPTLFEDDATGTITLYFQSTRPGGLGGSDIWASTLQPDGTFGTPVPVVELNSTSQEQQPFVSKDGLEMYLNSNRPGTLGDHDLWVSTRASTFDPWSTPVNLGAGVNSTVADTGPSLSFDGKELYFMSARPGFVIGPFPHVEDLWVSTRDKLKAQD